MTWDQRLGWDRLARSVKLKTVTKYSIEDAALKKISAKKFPITHFIEEKFLRKVELFGAGKINDILTRLLFLLLSPHRLSRSLRINRDQLLLINYLRQLLLTGAGGGGIQLGHCYVNMSKWFRMIFSICLLTHVRA